MTRTPTCTLTAAEFSLLSHGYSQYAGMPKDGLERSSRNLIAEASEEAFAAYWGASSVHTKCGADVPFKDMRANESKLAFIDKFIQCKLSLMARSSNTGIGKNGLKKYRGWVLNRTLKQMIIAPKDPGLTAYCIPDGILQLGTDLCFYDAARKEEHCKDKGITEYKTLAHFAARVDELENRARPTRFGEMGMTGLKIITITRLKL